MFTLIGGRRHPFFVSTRNGVITDVINRNIVELSQPNGGTIVYSPRGGFVEDVYSNGETTIIQTPRGPLFVPRLPEEIIVSEPCPPIRSQFLPYAITVTPGGAPTVIAIKNAPKNKVKIKPRTELIIQ